MQERQLKIESGESDRQPIMVYPEGGTSNNTSLAYFRDGAF